LSLQANTNSESDAGLENVAIEISDDDVSAVNMEQVAPPNYEDVVSGTEKDAGIAEEIDPWSTDVIFKQLQTPWKGKY
jgi:hypothetical protein